MKKEKEHREKVKEKLFEHEIFEENIEGNSEEKKSDSTYADEEKKLVDEVDELKKTSEDNYNKFLRMQADFDNFRKRVSKEKEDIYQLALEGIMKDLMPVVDNLERAAASFVSEGLEQKYVDGLEMVIKQLSATLLKNGLKEVDTTISFDPNFHHAIMQEPGDEDDKITMVMQKGYTLGSKVVRPAMVRVSVKN